MMASTRYAVLIILAFWITPLHASRAQSILSTGITGSVSSSGLEDPQYILSFPSVQRLILDATDGPVSASRAQQMLTGTPASLDAMVALGLLRHTSEGLRLNYLVLTVEDQRAIYAAARRFGRSLADAIMARRADFDAILAPFPHRELKDQLAFALVAGFCLNWEGLALSTQLGYRAEPPRHPNGDRYIVHSSENGAALDVTSLFWGSHTFPGQTMSFTTFGDGPSQPRETGVPDVFFGLADDGMEFLRDRPAIYEAVRSHYIVLLTQALNAAGDVMRVLQTGRQSRDQIEVGAGVVEPLLGATLDILEAIGYVARDDGGYRATVVVLSDDSQPLVDETLTLGREILTQWLQENASVLEGELADLTPMRNGLPFSLVFSEVWHYIFGFATKNLAESGFYADPYAPTAMHRGFVPIVWASSLYAMPG